MKSIESGLPASITPLYLARRSISGVKTGLIVCAILIGLLIISNWWFYTSLQGQITTLQTDYNNYKSGHGHSNNEYTTLQNELEAVKAAKLSGTLDARDVRPWYSDSYLHITGHVFNSGSYAAIDVQLSVEAYQDEVRVLDIVVNLGTIIGGGISYVDSKIYYSGASLSHWHIWSTPGAIDWTWYD